MPGSEQGGPLPEARAEVMATADQFDWYADEARRIYGRVVEGHSRAHRLLVLRQPARPSWPPRGWTWAWWG